MPGAVATYARISIDRNGEAVSTDRQCRQAHEEASRHGLPEPVDYIEPGSTSASKPRRKASAWYRLLDDIRAGRIGVVIVQDLDRLTRQPSELEELLTLSEQNGLRLITMDGECDTRSANGRMFLRVKAAVARFEVEHKAGRQRVANRDRAENGQPWKAGRRTFGYLPDLSATVPAEAEQVQQAFRDVANGVSLRSMTRRWNAAGSVSSQGNPWTTAALRLLLKNPTYSGRRVYWGSDSKGRRNAVPLAVADLKDVPAIVDADLFAAVQVILGDPTRLTSDRGGRGPLHLLSGLAWCGLEGCGARLSYGTATARRKGQDVTYRVLRCRECLRLSRAAEPIEEFVTAVALARLERADAADLFQVPAEDVGPLRTRAAALRVQREALAADLDVELSFAKARDRRLREELEAVETELASKVEVSPLAAFASHRAPREVWKDMDTDAHRDVIRALAIVKVLPVGRRGRLAEFDPASVKVEPRQIT